MRYSNFKNLGLIYLLIGSLLWVLVACQTAEMPTPETVTATTTATLNSTATSPPTTVTLTPAPSRTPLPPTPTFTPTPAFPRYQGPPLQRNQLGIQLHLRDEDQTDLFRLLEQLDVGWVKVQLSWKLYEPEPGQYHTERFSELDQFITQAQAHELQVLLSISKAPEWSRSTTEGDGPPTDFGLFTRFMQDVAARYQGQVAAYELWNEPNLQREWQGMPLGGTEFVRLVAAGAAGVRAVDTEVTLVAGAPAVTGIDDRITAVADRPFLNESLAAGLADHVDALGVHPYGFANPPDSSVQNPNSTTAPSHNNHPTFFFQDTLTDYQTILAAHNAGQLRLWVTEFAWGSFENVADAPPPGAEFMADVSEWQQAEYTLRAFELGQSDTAVGPMFLWNLNFSPLLGTEFAESGYSILRPDGTPRPVYFSLQFAPKE